MEHGLQVGNDGLDLDHEERSARGVEPQDVDRAALTTDVERDLGRDQPVVGRKELQGPIDEFCMTSIEHPIETFSLPQESDVDPRVEDRRDPDEDLEDDAVGVSTLDPPDGRPRHSSLVGKGFLRPASSPSECANTEPESDDIHRGSMRAGPAR